MPSSTGRHNLHLLKGYHCIKRYAALQWNTKIWSKLTEPWTGHCVLHFSEVNIYVTLSHYLKERCSSNIRLKIQSKCIEPWLIGHADLHFIMRSKVGHTDSLSQSTKFIHEIVFKTMQNHRTVKYVYFQLTINWGQKLCHTDLLSLSTTFIHQIYIKSKAKSRKAMS